MAILIPRNKLKPENYEYHNYFRDRKDPKTENVPLSLREWRKRNPNPFRKCK